jgi:hypothetical protein
MEFVRSYDSIRFGLPRNRGGSAPALVFSRPAQRSLTLRPARLPSRHSDPLHQRLQQFRCLHCCSNCYRVERTSSRAGLPPLWTSTFHGAPDIRDFAVIIHLFRSQYLIEIERAGESWSEGAGGLHHGVAGAGLRVLRCQQSGGHSTKHHCNRNERQCLNDLTQITSSLRKDRLLVCPACLSNFRVPRPLLGRLPQSRCHSGNM